MPQLGKGIGGAIRNFKKASSEPPEIDVTPKKNSIEKDNEEKKS